MVLLTHNSRDSLGGECVEELEYMSGFVLRLQGVIEAVEVNRAHLKWGKLYLRKKVVLENQ